MLNTSRLLDTLRDFGKIFGPFLLYPADKLGHRKKKRRHSNSLYGDIRF